MNIDPIDIKKGDLSNSESPSSQKEEKFLLDMFAQISSRLKSKYNYSSEEIQKAFYNEEILIPIYIFSGNLGAAEALAKFLCENFELSNSEISKLIGRDNKSIWSNYKRAFKKMPWAFESKDGIAVPVSVFNSELSLLESLIAHLRDAKKLTNTKIAKLLNKNPGNVWALYKRACDKKNARRK